MQIYFSLIISAVILRMPIVLFFFFSSQEDYSIGLTVIALKASMIHVWQITLFLPWITITNDLIQLFVFEVLGNVGRTLFHQKNEIKHFQVFYSSERNYFMVEWRLLFFFFHLFVIFKEILLRLLIVLSCSLNLKMFLPSVIQNHFSFVKEKYWTKISYVF